MKTRDGGSRSTRCCGTPPRVAGSLQCGLGSNPLGRCYHGRNGDDSRSPSELSKVARDPQVGLDPSANWLRETLFLLRFSLLGFDFASGGRPVERQAKRVLPESPPSLPRRALRCDRDLFQRFLSSEFHPDNPAARGETGSAKRARISSRSRGWFSLTVKRYPPFSFRIASQIFF